jgi:hypothetical protein
MGIDWQATKETMPTKPPFVRNIANENLMVMNEISQRFSSFLDTQLGLFNGFELFNLPRPIALPKVAALITQDATVQC